MNLRKILEEYYEKRDVFYSKDFPRNEEITNQAIQQILALIPSRKEPMPEDGLTLFKHRDSNNITAGYNIAISDMEQSMTGEK
jgi:hypothetical protein